MFTYLVDITINTCYTIVTAHLTKQNTMLDIIEASIKSEIKFDQRGRAFLSKRGFCRMTGVHQSCLVTGKMSVVLSKKLTDIGIDPDGLNEGIPDVALGVMVNYFAFQTSTSSEKVEQIADYLATVGARVALQKAGQWEPKELETLEPSVKDMFQKILANQSELDKWKAVEPHKLTGMVDIAEAYASAGVEGVNLLPACDTPLYTVNEWYRDKIGGELDKGLKHSIANRLAAMFKQIKKEQPKKKRVYVDETRNYYQTAAYPESDFPLLSCCLMQLIAEKTVVK